MLEPKEIKILGNDGKERTYLISKFPAIAGREIISQYPISGLPKLGEYKQNEELMLKLMSYVAVPREKLEPLFLTTRALINNHVDSWETLVKIEAAVMEYNCSFFQDGRVSNFLQDIAHKLPTLISKILTDSLRSSSKAVEPPTTN